MRAFADAAVGHPTAPQRKLLALRGLVFDTAARTPGVGEIEETLEWGQPAYLTAQCGSGSAVRIGYHRDERGEVERGPKRIAR